MAVASVMCVCGGGGAAHYTSCCDARLQSIHPPRLVIVLAVSLHVVVALPVGHARPRALASSQQQTCSRPLQPSRAPCSSRPAAHHGRCSGSVWAGGLVRPAAGGQSRSRGHGHHRRSGRKRRPRRSSRRAAAFSTTRGRWRRRTTASLCNFSGRRRPTSKATAPGRLWWSFRARCAPSIAWRAWGWMQRQPAAAAAPRRRRAAAATGVVGNRRRRRRRLTWAGGDGQGAAAVAHGGHRAAARFAHGRPCGLVPACMSHATLPQPCCCRRQLARAAARACTCSSPPQAP